MQLFDRLLNNTYEFPDGTPPEAIQQAVAPLHEQHFQQTKQQQLVDGMSGLGQAIFNATRREQRMPVVSPVAAMAMGPNYQSHREAQLQDIRAQQQQRMFDESQRQRQNMATAQQRMQERQMVAQQMEQEKDRAQALHLETQRMKNRQEEMRLQQQAQKEMEQWKQSQPGYDETRGVQYKLNPDTGNYETSVIDQNIYNRATAMPQYGGRGGGAGGGGRAGGGGTGVAGNVLTLPDGSTWEPADRYQSNWINRQTGEIIPKAELAKRGGISEDSYTATQNQVIAEQAVYDKELSSWLKANAKDYGTRSEAIQAFNTWYGSGRPNDLPPRIVSHSGYGSALQPNVPTEHFDFNDPAVREALYPTKQAGVQQSSQPVTPPISPPQGVPRPARIPKGNGAYEEGFVVGDLFYSKAEWEKMNASPSAAR